MSPSVNLPCAEGIDLELVWVCCCFVEGWGLHCSRSGSLGSLLSASQAGQTDATAYWWWENTQSAGGCPCLCLTRSSLSFNNEQNLMILSFLTYLGDVCWRVMPVNWGGGEASCCTPDQWWPNRLLHGIVLHQGVNLKELLLWENTILNLRTGLKVSTLVDHLVSLNSNPVTC